MIAIPAGVRLVVASRPVDFRNGLDGLAALVQQALRENPLAGDLFVFRAKRADRVKIWPGTVCVCYTSAWRKVASSGRQYRTGRFAWVQRNTGYCWRDWSGRGCGRSQ